MTKDIYVITNLITGTQYVGQSKDAKKRFNAHKKAKDNTLLHQAIITYGADVFELEVLDSQVENFNEREKYWIKKLNTMYPNGYNMTKGGEGYPHPNGELCYQAKLSQKELKEIVNLLKNTTLTQTQIGEKYNVEQELISNINVRRTYFNNEYGYPIRKSTEQIKIINLIKEKLSNTILTLQNIADLYNVSKATVSAINQGILYKDNIEYPIRKGKKGILDDEEILIKIKKLLEIPEKTTDEIAKIFGVQRLAIEQINQGKTYFHKEWDYPIRKINVKKNRLPIELVREVENLLINTNMSFRAIARKVGCKTHEPICSINSGKVKYYINPNLVYPLRKYNKKQNKVK